MIRKLFLILCLAFAVVAFGYPCVVLPLGTYSAKVSDNSTIAYEFKFNTVNIVTTTTGEDGNKKEDKREMHYKLDVKNKKVWISEDTNFDDNDLSLTISSFFRLNAELSLGSVTLGAFELKNPIAMWISIGVGVFALLLIVTIPRRRKN